MVLSFFCLITEHIDLQIGGFKSGLNPNVDSLAVTDLYMLSELTGLLNDDINSQSLVQH